MTTTTVHLHSSRGDCATVCGQPCGSRETTAYANLDPERVTCHACLTGAPSPVDRSTPIGTATRATTRAAEQAYRAGRGVLVTPDGLGRTQNVYPLTTVNRQGVGRWSSWEELSHAVDVTGGTYYVLDLPASSVHAAPASTPVELDRAAAALEEHTTDLTAVDPLQRDQVIRTLRADLKRRTGRSWSVTGGTGTAWGWITIQAPPARRSVEGSTTEDDRTVLGRALGLDHVHHQGIVIPAGTDYRREYLERAAGRTPAKLGTPYWD